MKKTLQINTTNSPTYHFKQATVHQDFLLHLFNPANDGKTSHEYFTKHGGKVTMYNSTNEKSEISKIKPLPNFAEFKLLMALLHFSQKKKSKTVGFSSARQLLEAIGYTPCGDSINLLNRTIDRYQWFRIHYVDSLTLTLKNKEDEDYNPNLPVNKGNLDAKKYTRNIGILVGFDKDVAKENIVTVIFDDNFWNLCNGDAGFAKQINLAVIKSLKSPRQLQIYLFLCKWMNNTSYAKWMLINIESFIEETGLHFNIDDHRSCHDLMADIKQTLNIVYRVDLECREQNNESVNKSQMWNIKLRESVFKHQRKIQFLSPSMKFSPVNGTAIDTDVMELSEWKELFPEISTDYWIQCTHTKDQFIKRKSLPDKFINKIKKQLEAKKQIIHKDRYADCLI